MKISVITAVKNGERFIRQTIESVLSQTGNFTLEYIIRDGCSSDKTLDIVREYGNKIILVSQRDDSPQEAINIGMNMATGDICCWLNADDLFLDGALQTVIDHFYNCPEIEWLYGRCRIIDENNKEIRKFITYYKNFLGFFYSKNILLCENYINQPATFWRRSLWKEIGGTINPKYKAAWDYDLWLKMAQKSRAIPVHKYLSSFRRTDGTISENFYREQFHEELEISKKYGNKIHALIHKFTKWKIVLIYNRLNLSNKLANDLSQLHTFIIPAYKESPYLEECIDSLVTQRYKSKILISTSTPSEFLTSIAKKYEIPIFINSQKNGIASDWNFALSLCETKYCTLAHQDDVYEADYTLNLVSTMEPKQNTMIGFCNSLEINESGKHYWKLYLVVKRLLLFPFYIKNNHSLRFIKKLVLSFGCPISCPSVVYNLERLKNFQFESQLKINLDWDTWLRLANEKGAFVYLKKPLFNHRVHSESETSKAIGNSLRKQEDFALFSMLWPKFFVKILLKLYSNSYRK